MRNVLVALVVGAALLLAVISLWPDEPDAPTVVPQPPLEVIDAGAADAGPPREVDAGPSSEVPKFVDPFCDAPGEGSFALATSANRFILHWVAELNRHPADQKPENALVLQGLDQRNSRGRRLEAAREAVSRWPTSLIAQLAMAEAAKESGLAEEQLAALRRALQLDPTEPAVGIELTLATRDAPDLDEAIAGLRLYVTVDHQPSAARWLARLEVARDLQRDDSRVTRNGVTLLWPPKAMTQTEAFELAGLVDHALDEAAALTGTQRRESLTVVVYADRSELLAVSCAPSWTGGLFDGTLRLVAGPSSDLRLQKTARHETLHAQLSRFARKAPTWFHEGVAEAFAGEDRRSGTWRLMLRQRTWIPFASLDGTFTAIEAADDANLAYAQALAMVEFLRDCGGDSALARAREAFERGARTPEVMRVVCRRPEVTGDDLLAFIERNLASPSK